MDARVPAPERSDTKNRGEQTVISLRTSSTHETGSRDGLVDASRNAGDFEHERRLVEAVQGSSFARVWYALATAQVRLADRSREPKWTVSDARVSITA